MAIDEHQEEEEEIVSGNKYLYPHVTDDNFANTLDGLRLLMAFHSCGT